jgi:hypothetical protein
VFETTLASYIEKYAINGHFDKPLLTFSETGRGVLLPARTHVRPSRIELSLFGNLCPGDFLRPEKLKRFAHVVCRAVDVFDWEFEDIEKRELLRLEQLPAVRRKRQA